MVYYIHMNNKMNDFMSKYRHLGFVALATIAVLSAGVTYSAGAAGVKRNLPPSISDLSAQLKALDAKVEYIKKGVEMINQSVNSIKADISGSTSGQNTDEATSVLPSDMAPVVLPSASDSMTKSDFSQIAHKIDAIGGMAPIDTNKDIPLKIKLRSSVFVGWPHSYVDQMSITIWDKLGNQVAKEYADISTVTAFLVSSFDKNLFYEKTFTVKSGYSVKVQTDWDETMKDGQKLISQELADDCFSAVSSDQGTLSERTVTLNNGKKFLNPLAANISNFTNTTGRYELNRGTECTRMYTVE